MNIQAPAAPGGSRCNAGQSRLWLLPLVSALLLGPPDRAWAQSFTIGDGTTVVTTRVMTGAGDTGLIEPGGAITPPPTFIGVNMTNSDQTLENLGLIETSGASAYGIRSTGTNAVIHNGGTIDTSGSNATAIYALGASADVVNDGLIHVDTGFAIRLDGDDSTLTNSGTIVADGSTFAIVLFAHGGAAINHGTVQSTAGSGIIANDDGYVVNYGSVLTGGNNGRGIEVGLGGRVENYGLVSTTGNFGEGLFNNVTLDGLYAHNYGTVLTTGTSARAMYWGGNNGHVLNAGTLETHGLRSPGIMLLGDNTVIENDGVILTTGDDQVTYTSSGIHTSTHADQALLINRGTISTTGANARGILVEGTNTTIVNSGSIFSAQSNAIQFVNGNARLELLAGTAIDGEIRFAGTGNAVSFGPGLNARMTFTGAGPGTAISTDNPVVVAGNTVTVLDRAGFALADDMSLSLLDSLAESERSASHCIAAATNSACGASAWLAGVGGYDRERGSGNLAGYLHARGGLVAGLELSPGSGFSARAFIGGGTASGEVRSSQQTDLTGGVLGAHLGFAQASIFADFYATLGIVGIDSRRSVADNLVDGGRVEASAATTGYAFTPSATLGFNLDTPLGVITPSLRARYSRLQLDGYAESGAGDGLVVDARTVEEAELRLQLAWTLAAADVATITLRSGIDLTRRQGSVSAELAGEAVAFDPGNSGTRHGGFTGLDFAYQLADGASLEAYSELGFDPTGISATGQLSYRQAF